MNKKPIIGILPTSNYMLTDDTFKDTYRFGNNYINKIILNGGVPLLIPYSNDNVIIESLEMCDGLLLPGGNRVLPSSKEVLKYFYDNKKPILGICLGMQTIGMFSMGDKKIIEPIGDDSHWPYELLRDNNDKLAHFDIVSKDSIMYEIFNSERIEVNSVHKCHITEVGDEFRVSIKSEDGIIEGIEYKNNDRFIIGLQFHPEVLDQYNKVFERFIEECKKISTK